MTDWDPATVDTDSGHGAFLCLCAAVAWLICAPFDLYARLRNGRSAQDDGADQGADWGEENRFHGEGR